MAEYSVYEVYDSVENYIGSVEAPNKHSATKKALEEYGAPIEVKND